jgi:RHS repeat-associated protein
MATYAFRTYSTSLQLSDNPVGYDPPRGPSARFNIGYFQRDEKQPANFTFANVGQKWRFDWVSWVEDNPALLVDPVSVYTRAGTFEVHTGYDGVSSYKIDRYSQAQIVRTNTSPIQYERRLPDGSVEVFSQSDGAVSPRRILMTQAIDPQGQALTFTYDSGLRLVAVTDAIGQVTTLTYGLPSDPLKLTKVTDPFGRSATIEYDASDHVSKITDVIGMASQFEYGSDELVRSLTTPYGTTTFTGGSDVTQSRWLEARDPLGGVERLEFKFASGGAIPSSEANVPPGFGPNSILNMFNSFYWDKRASALYPGDYTKAQITRWAWGYHTSGPGELAPHPLSTKKPLEGRVWYSYDGGDGMDQVGPMAKPSKIGRLLDDGSAQILRLEYNSLGRPTRFTDAAGRETLLQYDTNGIDLLNVKQKNGSTYDLLVSAVYDTRHEPTSITDTAGKVTNLTFNTNGTLATIVTPAVGSQTTAERTTTLEYFADNALLGPGRLKKITGPTVGAGAPVLELTYDAYGRPQGMTDAAESQTIALEYDALDRSTKVTYPDSSYEEVKYGRLDAEQIRDRLGRWTHIIHDALGRPTSVVDARGKAISVQWCLCGGPDKLVDDNGNTTMWTRDVMGRITRETRADNSYIDYTYESATSRLKQIKDQNSQYTNVLYFIDDRVKEVSFANAVNATPTVSYGYDAAYGRLVTMADGTGTTGYSYNPIAVPPGPGAGRLASIDGPMANDTIAYSYDSLGRAYQESINGTTWTATFDAIGRVAQIVNVLGTFTYNYVGLTRRIDDVTYPNGQVTDLGYLPASQQARLEEIHHKKPGGATLSKFRYAYDANGRIKTWTQQADSSPAVAYDFTYDPADQLVSATLRTTDPTPALVKRYVYRYDGSGNRTSEQIDDAVTQSAYDSVNELTGRSPGGAVRFAGSLNEQGTVTVQGHPAAIDADEKFDGAAAIGAGSTTVEVIARDQAGNTTTNNYSVSQSGGSSTLTYDANGNLTGDGIRTFEWDARDQLIAVTQGAHRTEFYYDGAGRRAKIVEKEASVIVADRRFLWSGVDMVEERDSSNAVIQRSWGNGVQRAGGNQYMTTDHLGSVRELTDNTGATRARYDYDPYGRATKLSGDLDAERGYAGMVAHAYSGLTLATYRAYDTGFGRWINQDPIGIAGGLNLYAYAGGDPVGRVDPLGLASYPPPQPLPGPTAAPPPPAAEPTSSAEFSPVRHSNPRPLGGGALLYELFNAECEMVGLLIAFNNVDPLISPPSVVPHFELPPGTVVTVMLDTPDRFTISSRRPMYFAPGGFFSAYFRSVSYGKSTNSFSDAVGSPALGGFPIQNPNLPSPMLTNALNNSPEALGGANRILTILRYMHVRIKCGSR